MTGIMKSWKIYSIIKVTYGFLEPKYSHFLYFVKGIYEFAQHY